jgi:hypothetical protein
MLGVVFSTISFKVLIAERRWRRSQAEAAA